MLGVQVRSQRFKKVSISTRSFLYLHCKTIHLSSRRLITSLIALLVDGSESTFWNIVFCGTYLMSTVEPQLEGGQFCTHYWKQVTGSSQ